MYEDLYEFRTDLAEVHRRLVYQLQRFWIDNTHELRPVLVAYRLAAAALALEVVLLTALAGGILG